AEAPTPTIGKSLARTGRAAAGADGDTTLGGGMSDDGRRRRAGRRFRRPNELDFLAATRSSLPCGYDPRSAPQKYHRTSGLSRGLRVPLAQTHPGLTSMLLAYQPRMFALPPRLVPGSEDAVSGITCPACHGSMRVRAEGGGHLHFTCRIGHAYSLREML